MLGTVITPETTQFQDPHTGAQLILYTQGDAINRTLYFTNRPFYDNGKKAVFLSSRTGQNQMYSLDLESGRAVQVTDLPGQPNVSSCLDPRNHTLYFHDRVTLHRVNLDTLKTEAILQAPGGMQIGILNLNHPPFLMFEAIEKRPMVKRLLNLPTGKDPTLELHHGHPLTLIYRYNVDTDQLDTVWGENKLLTHVQLSPVDPSLLIYSSWTGYGEARVQALDLSRGQEERPFAIFPENAHAKAGHEAFTRKGNLYAQWMQGDLAPGRDHTLHHAFVDLSRHEGAMAKTAPFTSFLLPERDDWLRQHFTLALNETWGVHDRWPSAPTKAQNLNFLSVFKHQQESPQTLCEPVCFHAGGVDSPLTYLGAETAISDDETFALFTTYLNGRANICRVDLRPALEKLDKLGRSQ
jgi:hypothetical protein